MSFWQKVKFLLRLPYVGEIGGKPIPDTVDLDHPEFGESSFMPTILEIEVDRADRLDARKSKSNPAGVGGLVHEHFFADRPRFVFNVCFSCARSNPFRPGLYTDPRSIWFNVFFGFYQIDVPKAGWGRPFAYESADANAAVRPDDILRIGKSDWNYFSNYVYGVPESAILPLNQVGGSGSQHGRERIGTSDWDVIHLEGVDVVSAYVSEQGKEKLEKPSKLLTPIWRIAFGNPHPREAFQQDFLSTRMRAHLLMAFSETDGDDTDLGEPAYRTLIFGATVDDTWRERSRGDPTQADQQNERFMAAQLEAIRKVIHNSYADRGF